MTKEKIANAVFGFVAGFFTIPLAAIAWPFVCAYFLYNETDECDEEMQA